jgi:hypothetical protein
MRIPILAVALALFALPSFAQQVSMDNQSTVTQMPNWPSEGNVRVPTPTLRAATVPNPSFPLRVDPRLTEKHYNSFWSDFKGHGHFLVDNTRYDFSYECSNPFFTHSEFQARWTKGGRKLDILLLKPDSRHTETCTFNILNHS